MHFLLKKQFLQFSFDPNPFFENSEIVKEFNWSSAEPHSTTAEIKWKPGKNKVVKALSAFSRKYRGKGDYFSSSLVLV